MLRLAIPAAMLLTWSTVDAAQQDDARLAFGSAVSVCRAAIAAHPGRQVLARPAGGFALLVNRGANIEAFDATVTNSLVTPAVGWVRVSTSTETGRFDTREAAEVATAGLNGSVMTYTIRLAWTDGRWRVRGASISALSDGAKPSSLDRPVDVPPESVMSMPGTAASACARAIDGPA